jgi:5-methylcytosine-specific restriction protein A
LPYLPAKPCARPGCGALTLGRFCLEHGREWRAEQDDRRGTAHARGYTRAWQRESQLWLRAHPLCQCAECSARIEGPRPSEVVDHIIPHKGDATLFWSRANWQAMAKLCHDRKTAHEAGTFGRAESKPAS